MTSTDPPDGILLDVTGCAHLFGAESALRSRLGTIFPQSRVAVADTAAARANYTTLADLACLSRTALDKLADTCALRSMGVDRRSAFWCVGQLDDSLPLFAGVSAAAEIPALPIMGAGEHVAADYRLTGLSLRAHPMGLLHLDAALAGVGIRAEINRTRNDGHIAVAGIVVVRQRPGSAKGTVFITIEDETGIANLVVWPSLVERYRN